MTARSESADLRVVPTEFGEVVLAAHQPDDRMVASADGESDRCWRCDRLPRASLDAVGLCEACGPELRDLPGD